MPVCLILASVALVGTALAGGLLVVIVGIRRSDRGRRLTGRPGGISEAFARHLLVGSRGYDSSHEGRENR